MLQTMRMPIYAKFPKNPQFLVGFFMSKTSLFYSCQFIFSWCKTPFFPKIKWYS